jgi:hypothetical protein
VKKWEQRLSPACSEVAQTYGTLENFRWGHPWSVAGVQNQNCHTAPTLRVARNRV